MSDYINNKIREKIELSDADQKVKDFLKDIIHFEYENFDELSSKSPRYSSEYERFIKRQMR